MRFSLSSFSVHALLGILLFGMLACHSNDRTNVVQAGKINQGVSYDTSYVHLALMPTADCLPFYYASHTGIYAKLGLMLKIHTFKGQLDCDTALNGGWMDGGYADPQRLNSFRTKPHVVCYGQDSWKLFVSGPLRVHQVSSLEQRLVAIARHSEENKWLDELLTQSKIKVENVFHVQVNDVCLRAMMLSHRQIDAAVLRWPYSSVARANGDRLLVSQPHKALVSCFVVNQSRCGGLKLNKDALALLSKGYVMALDSIQSSPKKAVLDILKSDYGISAEVADTISIENGGFFRR